MKQILRATSFTLLMFACLLIASSELFADDAVKKQALTAAKAWLMIIDKGQYEKCWSESSELIQKNVKQNDWANAIQQARKPLGKVVNRAVKMSQYTTSLPGAPQGEYVVIQFQTTFKNRPSAIETVTMRADSGSQEDEKQKNWAGAGYYIY